MPTTPIPALRITRRMPDAAVIAARALADLAQHDAETVHLDESAMGKMEADFDRATIAAARDLEHRIRACGKVADADVVRALINRVIDLTGGAL